MKTLEHELTCGCVITLTVGGELEPAIINDAVNQIKYCDDHRDVKDKSSKPIEVDADHEFTCGCEVDLTVTVTGDGDDTEANVTKSDLRFCNEHDGGAKIPDATLENIQLLAEGKHSLTCSRDQWCDCVMHLAGSALAELEAI